ncbi:GNAT family N-acetyltransferase [Kitasatospora sp. GP82]|uniref:GNAT family N-acetyltransferase n=1 Tax=Kitasatospora sp. GP82 TaxID=3035089 RepID=UPI002474EE3C|nr:GNAT family N-acetyltransferase [Kitasatospora sp. GP82]MDH6123238.1 GNAT superfamily N-acetyltransferase [Kitasatospora sp. GP82]
MTAQDPVDPRPEVRMDRSDVGRRVSVRRLSEFVDGRPVFRDVIGVLVSWDDHGLTVVPRDGQAVSFPEKLLVAGKTVPPFPARQAARVPEAGPVELQRIAARGWPAVEQEPLGEWILRASAGFTRRANSVQALGDPGRPLPEALAAVQDWYRERGLPAYVEVVTPGSPENLTAELDRLGAGYAPTLVRTAPLAPLTRLGTGHERVRLSRTAGPEWLSQYRRAGGDAELDRAAALVLHGGPSVWFATVPGPEAPLAIGRCVIDGPWACFAAIEVSPYARRTGLATTVMAVLAARAAEEGASGAYLQVEVENSGAIALYDRLGFRTSHTYHYAQLPQR